MQQIQKENILSYLIMPSDWTQYFLSDTSAFYN